MGRVRSAGYSYKVPGGAHYEDQTGRYLARGLTRCHWIFVERRFEPFDRLGCVHAGGQMGGRVGGCPPPHPTPARPTHRTCPTLRIPSLHHRSSLFWVSLAHYRFRAGASHTMSVRNCRELGRPSIPSRYLCERVVVSGASLSGWCEGWLPRPCRKCVDVWIVRFRLLIGANLGTPARAR